MHQRFAHHRKGFTKTIALGVVILVFVGYGIYYAMQPPFGYPEEKYRISHASGFSIIIPYNWVGGTGNENPGLNVAGSISAVPKKINGFPGSFSVSRLRTPPVIDEIINDGYEKSDLLPFASYRKFKKGLNFNVLNYYFEKDGCWYFINLNRNKVEPMDKWWLPFIASFKVEAPRPLLLNPSTNP